MTSNEAARDAVSADSRSLAVLNWSPPYVSLIEALARSASRSGVGELVCVGESPTPEARSRAEATGIPVRWVADPGLANYDRYVTMLEDKALVGRTVAVIVLPRRRADEPDALSRICCEALRKACGEANHPNVLVEVEDPEAAYEFHGLGVSTVFYSGYLRAALLGQACVDLGVFQFVYGLLTGAYRVVALPISETHRGGTFADAAIDLEEDDQGQRVTVIGVQTEPLGPEEVDAGTLLINPGPRYPLRDAFALLALATGEEAHA